MNILENTFYFLKFWFCYMICSSVNLVYKLMNIGLLCNFFRFLSGSNRKDDLYGTNKPIKIPTNKNKI
jgi:hypothetical protein